MAKKQEAFAKYVGDGDFLNGVPARDMEQGEWFALDEELREQAQALGIFKTRAGETITVAPEEIE